MISRRALLESSAAAFATRLFGSPDDARSNRPSPELQNLADIALHQAKKLGASYADIRINRYRNEAIGVRLSKDLTSGRDLESPFVRSDDSFGFGVRVIADGSWGFAASPFVERDEIGRIAGEAVTVARASAKLQSKPVELAPTPAYQDRWTSPFERNPFEVPMAEKLALLRDAVHSIKKEQRVFSGNSFLLFHSEDKYFASSEGSSIQQLIIQTLGAISANAVDRSKGLSKSRSHHPPPLEAGYEYVAAMNFAENAPRIREEIIEHLAAPPVQPGKKDLVLLPSHLCLTIHESLGHSTELDRALGYEANFAGTSFLTPDKMGKMRIGSPLVTVYGDRIHPQGLSTVAYDDDGVKTTRFTIIDKGIFSHYQTIRDQAHLIGEKESRGCCYADSWASIPFQRIPNVWLAPGPDSITPEDLIAGVDDGILIDGTGSWSIDQQRYNFQFGGDAFWEIKGGKKGGMLSRVAYQSRTPDFWQACDGIAGPAYWQQYGLFNDGKGQPEQINAMSHGSAPARFRQINVLLTD